MTTEPAITAAPSILGRVGSLVTRLAHNADEIAEAQRLRYAIFYDELGARPTAEQRRAGRDVEAIDAACDHLIVCDEADVCEKTDRGRIVATYRLLDDESAKAAGGWYSAHEFDLTAMMTQEPHRRHLELGRSCVARPWRNRRTMELLWHGAWALALQHRADVLFGCASLPGTDRERHDATLGWLARHAATPDGPEARAGAADRVRLHDHADTPGDDRRILAGLPPLVKGYLRLGATVGPEAFIDRRFGCIDLLVRLEVARINPRYLAHYGVDASRFAA